MADRKLAPDVRLREVWAWSVYDFANSGYTMDVTSRCEKASRLSPLPRN